MGTERDSLTSPDKTGTGSALEAAAPRSDPPSAAPVPVLSGPHLSGADVRRACRAGAWTGPTCGLAEGFAQANLVVLPAEWAYDFLLFCRRNPKPCPLLEVTEAGSPVPLAVAPGADLRTDLPRYRVWEHGELIEEPLSIEHRWRDDLVSFLIGCSFTFESALLRSGIPVRHIELGRNVPMYRTNVACRPAGRFHGPLVVSMRPLRPADAIRAVQITSRFPDVHGAPVHLGLPDHIGVADLSRPDYGDAVPVSDDELPGFWACGVTPQAVAAASRPPLMITHSPGCMFVTDVRDESLACI
ncbi:MAG TPA: putative hydro-lyase [Planctomycetaceae bacterium]|nr:putative hydro-lyase [Planctomycetaceae bacterium]